MYIDISQLEFIHPMLREIVIQLEHYLHAGINPTTLKDVTITSLYRMNEPGSVHGNLPLRGIDVRCNDDKAGEHIETMLNEVYIYDPDRPRKSVCIYHDNRGAPGKHLHIQVHDNTVPYSV